MHAFIFLFIAAFKHIHMNPNRGSLMIREISSGMITFTSPDGTSSGWPSQTEEHGNDVGLIVSITLPSGAGRHWSPNTVF
jgi:hypothetical protein